MKFEEYEKRLNEVESKINYQINELEADIKRVKENIVQLDKFSKRMQKVLDDV